MDATHLSPNGLGHVVEAGGMVLEVDLFLDHIELVVLPVLHPGGVDGVVIVLLRRMVDQRGFGSHVLHHAGLLRI